MFFNAINDIVAITIEIEIRYYLGLMIKHHYKAMLRDSLKIILVGGAHLALKHPLPACP